MDCQSGFGNVGWALLCVLRTKHSLLNLLKVDVQQNSRQFSPAKGIYRIAGKLSRVKTFVNRRKYKISQRKRSRIANLECGLGPNYYAKNSQIKLSWNAAIRKFSLAKVSAIQYIIIIHV